MLRPKNSLSLPILFIDINLHVCLCLSACILLNFIMNLHGFVVYIKQLYAMNFIFYGLY